MTSEPPKQVNSEEAAPPTANKTGVLEPSEALAQQKSDSLGTTVKSAENHDTIGFADELSTKEPCIKKQEHLPKKWQDLVDAVSNMTDEEYQAKFSKFGE